MRRMRRMGKKRIASRDTSLNPIHTKPFPMVNSRKVTTIVKIAGGVWFAAYVLWYIMASVELYLRSLLD